MLPSQGRETGSTPVSRSKPMTSSRKSFKTVDAYIASFPIIVQNTLQELRQTIKKVAPKAEETISYGIPAYTFHGRLVYFAAYENHIGIYPTTETLKQAFTKEIAPYQRGKGTLRFPLDKPLPFDLIKRLVAFRVNENREKKGQA